MGTKKEGEPSSKNQLIFEINGDHWEISGSLDGLYHPYLKLLTNQRLWFEQLERFRERKAEIPALLVDGRNSKAIVFDPFNWQVSQACGIGEIGGKKFLGAVVLTESNDGQAIASTIGSDVGLTLTSRAPVFVFAPATEAVESREETESALRKLGLVEVSTLTWVSFSDDGLEPQNLYRSRMPTKRKKPEPANLLNFTGEAFWRKHWLREICRDVIADYRKNGWKVTDWSKILGVLGNCRNPFNAIDSLRAGFGVRLSPFDCLCEATVDLHGTFTLDYKCSVSGCGVYNLLEEKVKEEKKPPACGECGGPMFWDGGRFSCVQRPYPSCDH